MEFRNPQREYKRFRRRLNVAALLVLLGFAVLFARFFWLQVVRHNYYRTRANDNRISLVPIQPNRGLIFGRNGIVLAHNYSAYTLEISPSKVHNLTKTIAALSRIVEINPYDIRRFKRLERESHSFDWLPIRNRLSDAEVARFVARNFRFRGVRVRARLFRQYPLDGIASHVLGYTGRITDRDFEEIRAKGEEDNYRGTEQFGKAGLEQEYEFELHGHTGFEQVEVDASGRPVRVLSRTPPVAGDNLTLTLDVGLQKVAEKAFGENTGALVAINPATGGILALVSMPDFNPNLFVDGIDSHDWQALNDSPKKPMLDRAIDGLYPPGSTFKPYMALAALENGVRTPQQTIHDPGYFKFGGHIFRDDKRGGHGIVNMYKSIVVSCDTYYYMVANDLGIRRIAKFMRKFGFGQRTGVDLQGEAKGVLPSPAWKKQHFKTRAQQRWYPGETISIGIGQGYNAYTPIQLAQAVATLANNGVMYRPHLVKYVTDTATGKRIPIDPKPERKIALDPAYLALVKRAMVGVNNNKDGTAWRDFHTAEYTSAGKTGTAQMYSLNGARYNAKKIQERLRDDGLFIAFAPVKHPSIALAVVVEHGGYGAESAAPIARKVLDYYLEGKQPAETKEKHR